jgi:hypothetical protein
MSYIPKNLGEVKEKDLDGYNLKGGYFLQLKHELFGSFPALISKDNKFFACMNKELLKKVWELLPKRKAVITEIDLYANIEENICFPLTCGDNTKPIHILNEKEMDSLSEKENPFKWASGLIGLKKEDVTSPFD